MIPFKSKNGSDFKNVYEQQIHWVLPCPIEHQIHIPLHALQGSKEKEINSPETEELLEPLAPLPKPEEFNDWRCGNSGESIDEIDCECGNSRLKTECLAAPFCEDCKVESYSESPSDCCKEQIKIETNLFKIEFSKIPYERLNQLSNDLKKNFENIDCERLGHTSLEYDCCVDSQINSLEHQKVTWQDFLLECKKDKHTNGTFWEDFILNEKPKPELNPKIAE
jgi:hypothetical protein